MTNFTHSLAILIGIDAYGGGIPRLTTAVNDATRLAELLRAEHGYETLLLTEPAAGQPITRARLQALFTEELKARLGDDDRLLVYFAGHGVAVEGDAGPAGYLVPQDAKPGDSASMLPMTELHKWLVDLPCRHMLAILDCCFAGAFRWAATRNVGALPDVIHKERYDRYLLSPAWQVLTSAAYDQKALDVLNGKTIGVRESDGKRHSPFALALFDALEKGDADLVPKGQGDGVITATELYMYLRQQVEVQAEAQARHEQTPGLWPLNKHRKGEFIFLAPGHPLNLPPAPELTGEANPYRGLKSYDQQDSPLFFGREAEIQELTALVDRQPFVAVLGASGTGKSSLVKAGLLSRLENPRSDDFSRPSPAAARATEAGSEGNEPVATANSIYRVLPTIRPTDQPLQVLAALLRAELGEDLSGLGDLKGLAGDDALAQLVARWSAAHPGQRLALTIDQFEELATLCLDDPEREHFLRLLADAVQQQPDAFRLIITLRTDFEPQFTQKDSPLAGAWQSARYVVPPMDIEDLRQVIEGPASVQVLYFDPSELVDDLIKEVIQTPGALPLLSFTLSELYVKYVQSGRDDRALSGTDYRALGGVVGSLRNRATEEYDHLPDDAHRVTMQRAMLRMIAVEGGELARRRVALSELDYPTAEENARVKTVLDRLVDARLLMRGTSNAADGTQGEAYVEPAHDALVLAWDKLLRWKKEAEEYLPLQRRLAQAAGEWSKAEPDAKSGLLWDNDPRLPQVEETLWPTRSGQKGPSGSIRRLVQVLAPDIDTPTDAKWLNGIEIRFAQASVRAHTNFWRRTVTIAVAVMLMLAGLTTIALIQRDAAVAEASRARAGEISAISAFLGTENPELATLLALHALENEEYVPNAERVLRSALQNLHVRRRYRHSLGNVSAVAFDARGSYFAIGTASGEIFMYDIHSPSAAVQRIQLERSVSDLDFSTTEPLLMVGGDMEGHLVVRNIPWATDLISTTLDSSITSVAFSPNGEQLVVITGNDSIGDFVTSLWQIDGWIENARLTQFNANVASYSPSRNAIALAGTGDDENTLALYTQDLSTELARWHTVDPKLYLGESGGTVALTFSPIGDRLGTAGGDGVIRLWDTSNLNSPVLRRELRHHEGAIWNLAFDSTGGCIIASGTDNRSSVWTANGDLVVDLRGHDGHVRGATFLPSERDFLSQCPTEYLTVADDLYSLFWTLSANEYATTRVSANSANDLAFTPDNRYVIVGGEDGTVSVRQVGDLQEVISFPLSAPVNGIDISRDGLHFGSADGAGYVTIWSLDDLQKSASIHVADKPLYDLAFNPQSISEVAAAGGDGYVYLAEASAGDVKRWWVSNREVLSVNFSSDGLHIFAGTGEGYSVMIDIQADKAAWFQRKGSNASIYQVLPFPNTKAFLAGDSTGKLSFWPSDSDTETKDPVKAHDGYVYDVALSHDGTLLATVSSNGETTLWYAQTGAQWKTMPSIDSEIYAVAFSADDRFVATTAADGMLRLLPVRTNDLIEFARSHVTRPLTQSECQAYGLICITSN